jgi:hypothetical protein
MELLFAEGDYSGDRREAGMSDDRERIRDISKRSCDSCNDGNHDLKCSDTLDDPGNGLPDHAWNCWHPKGTILVIYERPM